MAKDKGFTLIEIMVVMLIIGIITAAAAFVYPTMMQQSSGNATQSNLVTIYNAQKNYYFGTAGNGEYCVNIRPRPQLSCAESRRALCAQDLTSINCNLGLNIVDPNFTYSCNNGFRGRRGRRAPNGNAFTCIATNISDPSFTLTLTNASVVLPGGTGCATSSGPDCNPYCNSDHSTYCPN